MPKMLILKEFLNLNKAFKTFIVYYGNSTAEFLKVKLIAC